MVMYFSSLQFYLKYLRALVKTIRSEDRSVKQLTGAIYSSVPTNEFDCVTGSAINVGGGWLLDLLRLGSGCFMTCKTITRNRK